MARLREGYRIPLILALLHCAGLTAALVADGPWNWFAAAVLFFPVPLNIWCIARCFYRKRPTAENLSCAIRRRQKGAERHRAPAA